MRTIRQFVSAVLVFAASGALAQVPGIVNYQGRVVVNGTNFTGTGQFQFALVNGAGGATLWSNGTAAVSVPVSKGLYAVLLGDTAIPDMASIPTQVFTNSDVRLRVWFDGGGGLQLLSPDQRIAAVGYALVAATAPASGITGTLSDGQLSPNVALLSGSPSFAGTVSAAGFAGNGAGLTNVVALGASAVSNANLSAQTLSNTFWRLNGNADSVPGPHFLGTADNQPLELKVNGTRALRLEPNASGAPNLVGGSPVNFVAPGVTGATIAGGGSTNWYGFSFVLTNYIAASYSFIGGGAGNGIQEDADQSSIAGGMGNEIRSNAYRATIGSGSGNQIRTDANEAVIGGGTQNTIADGSYQSVIGGGGFNIVWSNATYSVIGGGDINGIWRDVFACVVGGGYGNWVSGSYGTVPGGYENVAYSNSFAAGTKAKARHVGTFVWADQQGTDFDSSADNQFLIRAAGGVGIGTNDTAGAALAVAGLVKATGFAGNGAGLTNVPLAAAAVGNANIASNAITSDKIAGGTVSNQNLSVQTLSNTFWRLDGNAGTAPGTHFLGTTDNQPLEVKVNGARALRIEPNSEGAPNFIGGASVNAVDEGVVSATIGGGGATDFGGYAFTNRVGANFGTIGGGIRNTIHAGALGATIAGGSENTIQSGGYEPTIGGGCRNSIQSAGYYATICGGYNNSIQYEANGAAIGGGYENSIETNANYATIGGGFNNNIRLNAEYATVAGGRYNYVSGAFATVAGGEYNDAVGPYAFAAGGYDNSASGTNSFAAGRRAKALHAGAFVWGDATEADIRSVTSNQFVIRASGGVGIGTNGTSGAALTVAGTVKAAGFIGSGAGLTNVASLGAAAVSNANIAASAITGDKIASGAVSNANLSAQTLSNTFWRLAGNAGTAPGTHFLGTADNQALEVKVNGARALRFEPNTAGAPNLIGGAAVNAVAAGAVGVTIGGGGASSYGGVAYTNRVDASFGTIGGGHGNLIQNAAISATVGGGRENKILTDVYEATLGGGRANSIQTFADNATLGGGYFNSIQYGASFSTLGGGYFNSIHTNAEFATLGGGGNNSVGGDYATVPGGYYNSATGTASFAAGRRAKALHSGAFVWGDTSEADIASTNANSVTLRAAGGYRLFSNSTATLGAQLSANATSWSVMSDRDAKENFAPVDTGSVLDRLAQLPLTEWNYKADPEQRRYIGPMAQDFHAAFGLGDDDRRINTMDTDGVTLAAIQGLYRQVQAEKARGDALERRLAELEKRLQAQ